MQFKIGDGAASGGGREQRRGISLMASGSGALASGAISFDVPPGRRLSEPLRQAICKIHCNLGHPSKANMFRFFKLGGVTGEVLEALEWMRCITCSHGTKPKTHRNVSMPPRQVVFGDEVQLDCFKSHDARGRGQWFLSILDRATSYHVITPLLDHSPQTLYQVFWDNWLNWAGPP